MPRRSPSSRSQEALAIGKEKGIADPQTSDACLKCHVTAFGIDAKFKGAKFANEEGISCEACHGAGGLYQKMTTMKELTAGKIEPASVGKFGYAHAGTLRAVPQRQEPDLQGLRLR